MKRLNITTRLLLFSALVILVSCKLFRSEKEVVINELIVLDVEDGLSLEQFQEDYYISKSDQLLRKNQVLDSLSDTFKYDGSADPVKSATLVNYFVKAKDVSYEKVIIEDGYPVGDFTAGIYLNDSQKALKTIPFSKGHISGIYAIKNLNDSLLYQTTFKKGNGYWKDYYLKENTLKEEGQVKKNQKVGVWKYYNQSGAVDSTKTYTLRDAVDVRFPHCLFNENN